jgi:hypothetical protein
MRAGWSHRFRNPKRSTLRAHIPTPSSFATLALVLFAAVANARTPELIAGDSVLLEPQAVIRFVELGGAEVLVRVTPLDRDGQPLGSGRVLALLPHERRAFQTELTGDAQLRVEVLSGAGRVTYAATTSRRRAVNPGSSVRPTSISLIDNAETSGAISSETALLYRVYAIFSDARLPAPYRGDDTNVHDSLYMVDVRDNFDSLSPPTQALVLPFLTPPAYKGSWASANGVISPAILPPGCLIAFDTCTEDWTNKPYKSFCRDVLAERIEELVLIISNSEFKDRNYKLKPPSEPAFLWMALQGTAGAVNYNSVPRLRRST